MVYNIRLDNVEKVKKYISIAFAFPGTLTIKNENYVVNGNSILGVFSLNLSKDLELSLDNCNDAEEKEFIKKIDEFLVK